MTIAEASTPKRLRRLKIDEFSSLDAPASVGSDVPVWKRDGGGGSGRDREALAKADARSSAAAARAAEAEAAIARRDLPRAAELLRDPDTYHAYYARAAGEEWRPPVAKAAAGPDHRAEIREAVAEDDFAELDRLVRLSDGAAGSTARCCGPGNWRRPPRKGSPSARGPRPRSPRPR